MSLPTSKLNFLKGEGYHSSYPEAWRDWLIDQVGIRASVPELEREWLGQQGLSGSVPQMWLDYARGKGYQSVTEMWQQGGPATLVITQRTTKTSLTRTTKQGAIREARIYDNN